MRTPPGILLLYRYADPSYYGGIERKMLFIATHLRDRGLMAPRLLTNYSNAQFTRDFAALDLPVHVEDMSGPGGLARTARLAGEIVDAHGIALLQTHRFWTSLAGALVRRRRPDLRHIHRVHTHIEHSEIPGWRSRTYHLLDRMAQRHIDRYVVLHSGLARELQERSRVRADRITVVPNGIPAAGAVQVYDEDAPLPASIGVVGELEPRKRHDLVIRAVAHLRREHGLDVRAVFAGGDSFGHRAALERLTREAGVEDLVTFHGYADHVGNFYRGLGAAVLLSDFEGIPTSIIEAMSMGMVVLASDAGGTADLVRDGRNGFLLRTGDWKGLADRLQEVFAHPASRWRAMRNDALRTYRDGFDVPVMMAGLVRVYEELGLLNGNATR